MIPASRAYSLPAFLVISLGFLIIVDQRLWPASRLEERVGKGKGFVQPVDAYAHKLLTAWKYRQRLQEQLQASESDADLYLPISMKLCSILRGDEEEDALLKQQQRVVSLFPDSTHEHVADAYRGLLEHAIEEEKREEVSRLLTRALALVRSSREAGRLKIGIVRAASFLGRRDLLEKECTGWIDIYDNEPADRVELLSEFNAAAEKLRIPFGAYHDRLASARVYAEAMKESVHLINTGDDRGAMALIQEHLDKHSRHDQHLLKTYFRCGLSLAREDVMGFWKRIEYEATWPKSVIIHQYFLRDARNTTDQLLLEGREDDYYKLVKQLLRQAPTTPILPYFQGELWARKKRKGPPPKPLHFVPSRTGVTITPDGILNEKVYDTVKLLPGPYYIRKEAAEEGLSTSEHPLIPRARIFTTATHIVVAAFFPEPEMKRLWMQKGERERDVWNYDCVEFLISPRRLATQYQQYDCGAGGSWHSWTYKPPSGKNSDPEVQCGVSRSERGYSVEFMIPLANLYLKGPISGKLLTGNLRRLRRLGTEEDERRFELVSWQPVPPHATSFGHGGEYFGFLQFE